MTREYPDTLKKFCNELETRESLLTTITETHNKLINTFISLDEALTRKSEILDTQIPNLKLETEKALEALKVRENCIPEKEVNLAASVEQLKESGIRDVKLGENDEKTVSEMLRMWFRRMDSKGLVKFLLAKKKELGIVKAEIVAASAYSVDLLGFLLNAIEEYVDLKSSVIKVRGMADKRWAYALVIQAVFPLSTIGNRNHGVATSLKDRAIRVLEIWKGVLGRGEGSGEPTMFLEMVIGFGVKDKFDDEFLMQLVMEFASRDAMAKLAAALGFGDKMRDIIEELVKKGKEVEAVYFAYETELTHQFPPVQLLESSLKSCRTSYSFSSLDDVNKELSTLKKIVKCIEDHKLESHFTKDTLQKRVNELEKIREKKRSSATASTSSSVKKRPRPENPEGARWRGNSRPPKAIRLAMAAARQNPHHAPPYTYTNPSSVYESRHTAASYGGVKRSYPVRYGRQYAYPSASHDSAMASLGHNTYPPTYQA